MGPFAAARERRGTPADLLVIGFGNPGAEYARTRHNSGADCVAELAHRHGGELALSKRERSTVAQVRIAGRTVALAFPQTFYNLAGQAAVALVKRYGIDDPAQIVVVHDELDLPLGTIRVKVGGGLAGNNGLRSLKEHLHTAEFLRVRIGVGKPPGRQHGRDHVLRRPGGKSRDELDITIMEAADAVERIVAEGVDAAMQHHNRRAPTD